MSEIYYDSTLPRDHSLNKLFRSYLERGYKLRDARFLIRQHDKESYDFNNGEAPYEHHRIKQLIPKDSLDYKLGVRKYTYD